MINSHSFGLSALASGRNYGALRGKPKDKTGGGSRPMGLALLLVIWLITLIGSYFIIAKTWWLPVGASAAAAGIDHHFTTTFILMGAVFIAAQLALGWFSWKYRDRGAGSGPAQYSHGSTKLEMVWTILTMILFIDRKSTRLNSSHGYISYAVFCLKKKKKQHHSQRKHD